MQSQFTNDVTITGIKEDSCLNALEYFHVTENVGVDIMHDVLEGVGPWRLNFYFSTTFLKKNCCPWNS